jgi:hypothetical protein
LGYFGITARRYIFTITITAPLRLLCNTCLITTTSIFIFLVAVSTVRSQISIYITSIIALAAVKPFEYSRRHCYLTRLSSSNLFPITKLTSIVQNYNGIFIVIISTILSSIF